MRKWVLILLWISVSCSNGNDSVDGRRGKLVSVVINPLTVPDVGSQGQDVEIAVRANAPSGCYLIQKISMSSIDDHHFLLKAWAIYDSQAVCIQTTIWKDTTFLFRPLASGNYYFEANEAPQPIVRDTLVVN